MEAHDRTEIEANGEIVVFSILKPSACAECGAELWKGSFLRMEKAKPLCLECADLDHLVFLPRGDVALTRRSRKYSTLSAVVVRFSRDRFGSSTAVPSGRAISSRVPSALAAARYTPLAF